MRRPLLPALLLLTGCVTTTAAPAPPARPLPDGVYQHQVQVYIERMDPQEFHGVLKKDQGRLTLVLLSPFDTTLARIADDVATDHPTVEAYTPEIQAHTDRIEQLYLGLKPVLLNLAATRTEAFGYEGQVEHAEVDARGIPRLTTIKSEHFHIDVTVSHYEIHP